MKGYETAMFAILLVSCSPSSTTELTTGDSERSQAADEGDNTESSESQYEFPEQPTNFTVTVGSNTHDVRSSPLQVYFSSSQPPLTRWSLVVDDGSTFELGFKDRSTQLFEEPAVTYDDLATQIFVSLDGEIIGSGSLRMELVTAETEGFFRLHGVLENFPEEVSFTGVVDRFSCLVPEKEVDGASGESLQNLGSEKLALDRQFTTERCSSLLKESD